MLFFVFLILLVLTIGGIGYWFGKRTRPSF